MERKNIILLESEEGSEYIRVYKIIEEFTKLYSQTNIHIGFSANAGEFGGFVTDDKETFNRWVEIHR